MMFLFVLITFDSILGDFFGRRSEMITHLYRQVTS